MTMKQSVMLASAGVGAMLALLAYAESERALEMKTFRTSVLLLKRGGELQPYVLHTEQAVFAQGLNLLRIEAQRQYRALCDRNKDEVDPQTIELVWAEDADVDVLRQGPAYIDAVMRRYVELETVLLRRRLTDRRGDAIIASSGFFFTNNTPLS